MGLKVMSPRIRSESMPISLRGGILNLDIDWSFTFRVIFLNKIPFQQNTFTFSSQPHVVNTYGLSVSHKFFLDKQS